jgi:hypothetical protein
MRSSSSITMGIYLALCGELEIRINSTILTPDALLDNWPTTLSTRLDSLEIFKRSNENRYLLDNLWHKVGFMNRKILIFTVSSKFLQEDVDKNTSRMDDRARILFVGIFARY